MLHEKFDQFQIWANNTQHVARHRNGVAKRTEHVATNNVALKYCDRFPGLKVNFILPVWWPIEQRGWYPEGPWIKNINEALDYRKSRDHKAREYGL